VKLHPLLRDPQAVLVFHSPVSDPVGRQSFTRAAHQAMAAMQIELEGEKAVIKPNLTSGERLDCQSGVTTHPAFVRGMVEYLHNHGAPRRQVYILEDPRDIDDNEPRHWRGTGFPEMEAELGVKLRCPTSYTCVKRRVPRPLVHPVRNVSRLAVGPNTVLFNVPKLKNHGLTLATLCMKNLMGVDNVFDRHYCSQSHNELAAELAQLGRPVSDTLTRARHEILQEKMGHRLADLAKVVKPQLNIVEGVVGRDGTGFQRGVNHSLGLVIAGTNVVAVDSVASYIMGFDPSRLIYLRVAAEAGLGANDINQICVYRARADEDEMALVQDDDLGSLRAPTPLRPITGATEE